MRSIKLANKKTAEKKPQVQPREPEHPGLKIETWATHSIFVRAIFIFLGGAAGPGCGTAGNALRCRNEDFNR
jgi:hypothetical protein